MVDADRPDHQAVDPALEHEPREQLPRLLLLEVLCEHDREAELAGPAERAAHQLRVDGVAERGNEQAERARRRPAQAARGRVRPVAELASGVEHPASQLLADRQRRVVVQDPRRDRLRRLRGVCDVGEPGANLLHPAAAGPLIAGVL
jgi:hypothetical protein